ncbi:MAG TPA: hypothetical protein VGQ12_08025 [Candidatus Angelobacter sp.]|jgi:hypothetical protein|nr:hypothetical protein [Candidatus Angelobacter sp.]
MNADQRQTGKFAIWQWSTMQREWLLMVNDVSGYSSALSISKRMRNKFFPCVAIEKINCECVA